MDKELVPELRFDGFTDPWEEKKFSDAFSFLKNNTLSRANLSSTEGTVRNIHYGDVLIKYGSMIDIYNGNIPRIKDEEVAANLKYNALSDGDVVIADTAEDYTAGKCTEINNIDNIPVVAGLHTIPVRPKIHYAKGFLGHYINSNSYHKQLIQLLQGIKVISISKASISNTEISFPVIEEQGLISGILCNLDSLIAEQEKKCAALGAARDALLDKMFPKEGETEPELRLDGFSGPWERVKLGELLSYEQPQAYIVSNSEYNDSHGIPVLTAGKTFILGYTDECFGVKQATKMKPVILFDDFTTACKYVDFPFKVKSSAAKILIPTTKCDCTYLVYESMNMINYEPLSHGRHWISMFSSFSINLPVSPFERQMLNFMLINIDENINGENQKLDLLKQLKGAMLDKMFPKGAR